MVGGLLTKLDKEWQKPSGTVAVGRKDRLIQETLRKHMERILRFISYGELMKGKNKKKK